MSFLLSLSALFAMEINVTKNLLTGESTVLSTATVPTAELNRHTGLKVFDDGRKCVYALNSQEVLKEFPGLDILIEDRFDLFTIIYNSKGGTVHGRTAIHFVVWRKSSKVHRSYSKTITHKNIVVYIQQMLVLISRKL